MKALTKSVLSAAAAASLSIGAAHAGDAARIAALLGDYETALNASNTDAVMQLYAEDGVFMAQHSAPNVGRAAVRAAYDNVFDAITLAVKFDVDEIQQVAPAWAFVRTRSDGVVTINATGDTAPEANQELFILNKDRTGAWKIARYIFSTTNPPRQ